MFSIIQAAGWPIWFLLVTSVIAVALIIERSAALRRAKIVPAGLLQSTIAEYRRRGRDRRPAQAARRAFAARPRLRRRLAQRPELARSDEGGHRGSGARRSPRAGTLPDQPRHHRLDQPADGAVRHHRRHDRDLRFGDRRAATTRSNSRTASRWRSTTPASASSSRFPAMIFYRHFRALVDSFVDRDGAAGGQAGRTSCTGNGQ